MVTFDTNQIIFASIGGLLLGVATSFNYIVRGKVTGMSGIAYGIISLNRCTQIILQLFLAQLPQKLSIVGGMFLISSIIYLIYGNGKYGGFQLFGPENQIAQWTTWPGFVLAGFFVGFGTKLGNGCTSGHGLCGLPRFSIRSLVAVCTFLAAGIGMSTFAYHLGLTPFVSNNSDTSLSPQIHYDHQASAICFAIIGIILPALGLLIAKKANPKFLMSQQLKDQIVVFFVGLAFGLGLMISGMSRRLNILQFLQINQYWNPALLFVLSCGLLVNTITFSIMRKKGVSLNGNAVFDPKNSVIDWQLVVGSLCFGIGWGIGGLCPGPFLVLFSVFTIPIQVLWGIGLIIGMIVAAQVAARFSSVQPGNVSKIQPKQTKQRLIQ